MRHRKAGIKLNRTTSHREAMFRNMVTSLFKHDRIRTTATKANELKRRADQLITLAKRGDLHARRQALAIIREKEVVHKLFEEAPKRFAEVSGGYTRVIRLGRRPGDAAPISLVEFVSAGGETPKKKKAKKKSETTKKSKPAVSEKPAQTTTETPPVEETAAVESPEPEPAGEETAAAVPEDDGGLVAEPTQQAAGEAESEEPKPAAKPDTES